MDYKTIREITEKGKDNVFLKYKEKMYAEIQKIAEQGGASLEFSFPMEVRRDDIATLVQELIDNGFKAKIDTSSLYDKIEVSWYERE
jgi:hypothetical protein